MPTEEEIAAAKAAEEEAAKKAAEDKKGDEKPGVTMDQVVAGMKHLHTTNQALINELNILKQGMGEERDKPKPKEDDKEVNLETMTRNEFMGHMLKAVEEHVATPIKQQQADDEQRRFNSEARSQIEKASSTHADFWDFKDEIKVIIDEHPNLDIEDAYVLARSKSPDKASLIDTKAAEEEAKAKAEEEKEAEPKYGGLLPTSGNTKRSQHMKSEDAAEAAWNELGLSAHIGALNN